MSVPHNISLYSPLIDFSNFVQGDLTSRRETAAQVRRACQESGFFYCRHLGIAPLLIEQTFACSQRFFDLPPVVKNQTAWSNSENNRGYIGLQREKLNPLSSGDWKEAFNVGQEGADANAIAQVAASLPPTPWPQSPANFRTTVRQFYQACSQAVDVLLEALAIALQLPDAFFVKRHQQRDYTLRLLHYPSRTTDAERASIRAGEHSDYGSITLLFQDDIGGFEVRTTDGNWIAVPPIPDAILVNVGDLLQRWTNDIFRSAVHRVRLPTQESRSRYSIAFFGQPDFDVEVACLKTCQSRDRPPRYGPVRSGEYLLSRLNATY